MEKFLIKKSLIPKDSFSTQDKHDDYNSRPNSSIPQDSCVIIIIIYFFILFFFCDVIFKFCNEHPEKNSCNRHWYLQLNQGWVWLWKVTISYPPRTIVTLQKIWPKKTINIFGQIFNQKKQKHFWSNTLKPPVIENPNGEAEVRSVQLLENYCAIVINLSEN